MNRRWSRPDLPTNPLGRFVGVYEALGRDRRWWESIARVRLAAVAAVTAPDPPDELASTIGTMSSALATAAKGRLRLDSQFRFVLAVVLVLHRDRPDAFVAEVQRVRGAFRAARLRRSTAYELTAATILRLQQDLRPISTPTFGRFVAIYRDMAHYHRWLTGPDDYPSCALLAAQDGDTDSIGAGVEAIYRALRARRFPVGSPLQRAAALLFAAHPDPDVAVERFVDLTGAFREARVRIFQRDYDELAMLSYLDGPEAAVARVLEHRVVLGTLRPRLDRGQTFDIASGIVFVEGLRARDPRVMVGAKALLDMQMVIRAQQAAAAG